MKRIVALVISIAMLIPGAAVASANSTQSSYGQNDVHSVVSPRTTANSGTNSAGAPSTSPASTGSLPFTGLDVGALAVGGIVLLGAGVVVRRMSAADDKS